VGVIATKLGVSYVSTTTVLPRSAAALSRVLSDMRCASRVTGTGNSRQMAMQEGG
jgi:hypothetical protein